MIQEWLRDKLKPVLPTLGWTVDYESQAKNGATVFYEGGSAPARFDIHWRYPRYMVWLSADDWELADYAAQKIYDTLHLIEPEDITVEYRAGGQVMETKTYRLKHLKAESDPNPIGIEDGKRLYSINFTATMIEI